jgi:DNA modification methylase
MRYAATQTLEEIPTLHRLVQGDARDLSFLDDESIHLAVTSPPYWTLKRYNETEGQMGHIEDYEQFVAELSQVWKEVFRVLVPGGGVWCVWLAMSACRAARTTDVIRWFHCMPTFAFSAAN